MQRRHFLHALWATGLAACGGGNDAAPPANDERRGTLRAIPMPQGRAEHAGVSMADGRVLLIGGSSGESALTQRVLAFEPQHERFVDAGGLLTGRTQHSVTALDAHTVLIFGGSRSLTGQPVAEIFDLRTGQSRATLTQPPGNRSGHTATALGDGRVLLAGGVRSGGRDQGSTAEIFDPHTEQFTPLTSRLLVRRAWHSAIRLDDRSVLLYGGSDGSFLALLPEWFDIPSNSFVSIVGPGTEPVQRLNAIALRSRAGQVLMIGGENLDGDPIASVASLWPTSPFNGALHAMRSARSRLAAAPLNDGRVLIAGGQPTNAGEPRADIELFNPDTGRSIDGPTMAHARRDHSANLLPSGQVLLAGGYDRNNGLPASAELFTP